jgi:transcriptional repressor NrdR
MVCTYCGKDTRVVNSRLKRKGNQVWRRRHCVSCGATFSTEETARHELAWQVWDGDRPQPFLRDKLFLSLYKSCEHRKTALTDAQGLTDTVIRKLPAHMADSTVSGRDIAQIVQIALNRFDKAASVHYDAYHRRTG